MDDSPQLQQCFAETLSTEIQLTRKLHNLLREEYQALQNTNPDLLEELANIKKELIERLEKTLWNQNRFLAQNGYTVDDNGVGTYLDSLSDPAPLRQHWNDLKQLLADCRKQNEINSGVVVLSQRQISTTLELLYGLSGRDKSYGPRGESQTNHASNLLGKA